jgi:hypothetical protein
MAAASAGRAGFPIALICISLFVSQVTNAFLTFSLSSSLLQCTPRTSYYRMINFAFCIIAFRKIVGLTENSFASSSVSREKAVAVCLPGAVNPVTNSQSAKSIL